MKDYRTFSLGILVFILSAFSLNAANYRTDEVIVKFKTKNPQGLSSEALVEERPIAVAVDDADKAIKELRASDDVEYAEPNYIIKAETVPDDWPYPDDEWSQLGLEDAWDLITKQGTGQQVVVAVVDSGVDMDHPDLQGRLLPGYDFANHDDTPEDDAGHGTKVCGILGAAGNNGIGIAGVAWDVNIAIMPVKFMKLNNGETTGNLSDAIDAIYYAVDHGAEIINASWGFYDQSSALDDAIAYARNKGVLFVASAGNNGQNNDTTGHYPSNCPYDNVIAVAAMDTDGSLASFSNYGLKTVQIMAPGVGITTTTINSGYVSNAAGTSFATPFVAGIAAMVLSQSPNMGYKSLREAILNSATKIPSAGSSMVSSGGCVNAYEALLTEGSLDTSTKSAQESPQANDTNTAVASASDGGSSGGGCLIETAHTATGTCGSAILFMITIVVFQVIRRKDLE